MPSKKIVALPVLHDPPGVASVNVIVEPVHTADGPLMADGEGSTVITLLV